MGNYEALRRLKVLGRKYCINQKGQSDDWPLTHSSTFQDVQEVGETQFQGYNDSINGSPDDRPWRRQNKARAEWLVKQAERLSENTANENTWRMRVENVILERFSVEVACPLCDQRLWRSEIEASFTGSNHIWTELEQRRLKRETCTCPPDIRPQDRYEIATSRLFEECVDELVVHEDPLGELPKQRPDRVIGLRETNNIRQLLDQPLRLAGNLCTTEIRNLVGSTPFEPRSSPLLFPFLVLEAKSNVAPTSFSDIQTQTSFPIWSLLNLQRNLWMFRPQGMRRPEPLVWFLGYRGKNWELYGCYLSLNPALEPSYSIHYLRGGDIATKDGALQLLLLIDYIVDWARDVFRPSIIAELMSLTTGRDLDDISLGPDSDIVSKQKTILDWMSRGPSTVIQDWPTSVQDNMPAQVQDDKTPFTTKLPDTELGVVRHAAKTQFQLSGLRLTESNVDSLLALSDALEFQTRYSQCARKLLNEFTRWDEMLLVLGADLDHIENVWSGKESSMPDPFDEGPGAEFYAVFEYRCFMNENWDIIREFTYMAISKTAFAILLERAAFQRHPRIERFSNTLRPCSTELIEETVKCLRSGSPWQVLFSALSSTLLCIYPGPEKKRNSTCSLAESLGLGHPRNVRVRYYIEDYMKLADRAKPRKRIGPDFKDAKRVKTLTEAWEQNTTNRSFRRTFWREVRTPNPAHEPSACTRCTRSNQDVFTANSIGEKIPSPTAYGAVLVASLKEEPDGLYSSGSQNHHDIGLFVLDSPPWVGDKTSISVVVEDLAQNDSIYHTIRHDPSKNIGGLKHILWNLPGPYRKSTIRQRADIERWTTELNGQPIRGLYAPEHAIPLWIHQQVLLHFLRKNMSYDEALSALIKLRDEKIKFEIATRRAQGYPPYKYSYYNVNNALIKEVRGSSPDPDNRLMHRLRLCAD